MEGEEDEFLSGNRSGTEESLCFCFLFSYSANSSANILLTLNVNVYVVSILFKDADESFDVFTSC